jgi:hypothetical protein
MSWDAAINAVRPHVVRIETPSGWGTGFLAFYNIDQTWCGIATAAHVVSHADEWQEPIKITNEASAAPRFLRAADERVIFIDRASDSAVVLFFKGDLQLPQSAVALLPMDEPCGIGADIGWLGYPIIEPNTLCFFAGTVSARQTDRRAYLIDGVAINGVSGGPVFQFTPQETKVIGAVSAYHANRATGEALPGLLRAVDVSHFHGVAGRIRDLDEANAKKREFEAAQRTEIETIPALTSAASLQDAGDDTFSDPQP